MSRTATASIGNDTLLERELPSDTAHPVQGKQRAKAFCLFIRLFTYFALLHVP